MNVGKELVKIEGLSKQTSVVKILRDLKVKYRIAGQSSDLPIGIIMDDKKSKIDVYLLFLTISQIEKFKKMCFTENGMEKIAILNHDFHVEFCNQHKKFNLDDMKVSDSKLELKIRKKKKENLLEFLLQLPTEITNHKIRPRLISVIENRNSIFSRFDTENDAKRIKKFLIVNKYHVQFSKSYTYISTTIQDRISELSEQEIKVTIFNSQIEAPNREESMEIDDSNEILELESREVFSETELESLNDDNFVNEKSEDIITQIINSSTNDAKELIANYIQEGVNDFQLALIPIHDIEIRIAEPVVLLPIVKLHKN